MVGSVRTRTAINIYAKAGLNWHQVCIVDKQGKTDGMVQLLPEVQTSWQVFNLFVHAVNELKKKDDTVTGVIGQSDISD